MARKATSARRVAETELVVELDAVEDARPVVEAEDVVGQQVAVAVDGSAARDPLLRTAAPGRRDSGRQALDAADREASTMSPRAR